MRKTPVSEQELPCTASDQEISPCLDTETRGGSGCTHTGVVLCGSTALRLRWAHTTNAHIVGSYQREKAQGHRAAGWQSQWEVWVLLRKAWRQSKQGKSDWINSVVFCFFDGRKSTLGLDWLLERWEEPHFFRANSPAWVKCSLSSVIHSPLQARLLIWKDARPPASQICKFSPIICDIVRQPWNKTSILSRRDVIFLRNFNDPARFSL